MKIKLSSFCWQCFNETNKTKEDYERLRKEIGTEDVEVEFNDENLYQIKCSKGHISNTRLQNEKFELLFDIAALALIDGYTKECASTIASSLERFIEYYIKVIAIKKKVEVKNYLNAWRLLSKQSERQLGAFYLLQLSEYGETKFVIADKWITFRNRVIHQGYIPSSSETIEYGEYVLAMIFAILKHLKENDIDSLIKAQLLDFFKNGERITEQQIRSSANIPTIIGLSSIQSEDFGKQVFKKSLESISQNGFYKHFYSKTI